MANFQFLLPEFKPLYEPAKGPARRVPTKTDRDSCHGPHPDQA
jgi:hypothetical protein